ncbi:MAG TPA: hypothetical protein VGR15_05750 [Bacteroidota bacterium]|jgi:hypothetical protein|nr:hypothetical protein [Bacteroidota bacterium]
MHNPAVSCVLVLLIGAGCTSTSRVTQSELEPNGDRDITVYTNDGRIIGFKSGEYRIIDENFGSIQGKGKLYTDDNKKKFKEFEGSVAFAEIQKISESHTTALGYAGVVAGATIILILIGLSQIKIGHL